MGTEVVGIFTILAIWLCIFGALARGEFNLRKPNAVNFDHSLIRALERGDEKAFATLFDATFGMLHELAFNYVFDSDTANDIVQEAYIALYRNARRIGAITNLGGYLNRSVRNGCISHLRKLSLEDHNRRMYIEELVQRDILDDDEREALLARVYAVIEQLPAACREICLLRYGERRKIKEIAAELEIAESTVKVQLSRAMLKLRDILGDEVDENQIGQVILFSFLL